MKLLTKSATFLNVLSSEFSLLKIEIPPVINLINLGSINRALKSVKQIHTANNRYSFVKNRYSFAKNRYRFAR
jgi:hypothetical protein